MNYPARQSDGPSPVQSIDRAWRASGRSNGLNNWQTGKVGADLDTGATVQDWLRAIGEAKPRATFDEVRRMVTRSGGGARTPQTDEQARFARWYDRQLSVTTGPIRDIVASGEHGGRVTLKCGHEVGDSADFRRYFKFRRRCPECLKSPPPGPPDPASRPSRPSVRHSPRVRTQGREGPEKGAPALGGRVGPPPGRATEAPEGQPESRLHD